ncbi:MAG: trypsin-like peptidase domain-containing protein [Candidatus Marinimicrobia bacterium]|nr:trypsin-like peptidase domain-containing protein [Candidatus Neomarinimicrobiota bacterium]
MKTRVGLALLLGWGVWVSAAGAEALPVATGSARVTPVVRAVSRALPTVVNIGTERMVSVRYDDPLRRRRGDLMEQWLREFLGGPTPGYQPQQSLGSGVIIDAAGYILTNYHVVERASRIQVTLADGTTYEAERLAGDETGDLALLKIEADAPLPVLPLAAAEPPLLGETVIVVGNPFGLGHSVSVGVLSGINREARHGGQVLFRDILQIDAAVNPGNSGGPLVNLDGELLGISVAFYEQGQNIGFAVPISRVRGLLEDWLTPETARGVAWGVTWAPAPDGGLEVTALDPDGSAQQAGLRVGDRVLALDGRPVNALLDAYHVLAGRRINERVTLQVARDDGLLELDARLRPRPRPDGELLAAERLGLLLGALDGPLGAAAPIRRGLPILEIHRDSPLARWEVPPGARLLQINQTEVHRLDDVGRLLDELPPGAPINLVLLLVEEQGRLLIARTRAVRVETRPALGESPVISDQ